MKFRTIAAAASIALAASLSALSTPACAQDAGPWLIRFRAVDLASRNKDSTGLDLTINDKVIPEVDVSYFFTPNWATELVLTYPQEHTIRADGTRIGSLKHLPPTLTLQYHVTGLGIWKPYAGLGVNYTRFSSVEFSPAVDAALSPSIEKNSVGAAAQVGIDIELAQNWSANLDVKKLQLRTDVRSFGSKVGEFKVDPWLIGAGVGYRF